MTIKFYLNAENVYCRITIDRRKAEIKVSDEKLMTAEWNTDTQRAAKKYKSLNQDIEQLFDRIRQENRRLEYEGQYITAKLLKELATGKIKTNVTFKGFALEFLDRMKENGRNAHGTIVKYRARFDLFERYLEDAKMPNLKIGQVTLLTLEKFDIWLRRQSSKQTGKPFAESYIKDIHKRLSTLFADAAKKKHRFSTRLESSPYDDFEHPEDNSVRPITYLVEHEVDAIRSLDLRANESLERVRDIFVWSCYTGQHFQNAMDTRLSDIHHEDGQYWLAKDRTKTGVHVALPLLGPAEKLYMKWRDSEHARLTGKLLPQRSNVKVNAYLKVIADLAGIENVVLTHKVARHTCGTWLRTQGVPLENIQAWLGHSSIKTTQIYSKPTRALFREQAKRLNEKLEF